MTTEISRTFILLSLTLYLHLETSAQVLMDYKRIDKPDFCLTDSAEASSSIGRQAKIWHEGGVYSTFNQSKKIEWPSAEIKKKGGQSGWGKFRPKAGDNGTIVHVFTNNGGSAKYVYLLKIGDYYVPISCSYLTTIDKPDSHEQSVRGWIEDSISNVNYAAGCQFKLQNVNNSWSRAGLMNIDKQSESFACDLVIRGLDTVMLCKYIFDNGSSPNEKAFILWLDKGQGYLKAFFNNSKHQPTENKPVLFDAKPLIDYFFQNRIDTVSSEPKSDIEISHSMGYSIQIYTPANFFRQRLTDFIIQQDKAHPKAIWWNMIAGHLGTLKEE